jgi:hypothetical protein
VGVHIHGGIVSVAGHIMFVMGDVNVLNAPLHFFYCTKHVMRMTTKYFALSKILCMCSC